MLARLVTSWQGVVRRRAGLDALLDTIENLQGAPLPASIFESEILAARIEGYTPTDLDALTGAGEVVWRGVEPLGERDGRIALYLTDHLARPHPGEYFLEVKSRTWSRRDAQDKAAIITELLARLGARPDEATEEGYVEL